MQRTGTQEQRADAQRRYIDSMLVTYTGEGVYLRDPRNGQTHFVQDYRTWTPCDLIRLPVADVIALAQIAADRNYSQLSRITPPNWPGGVERFATDIQLEAIYRARGNRPQVSCPPSQQPRDRSGVTRYLVEPEEGEGVRDFSSLDQQDLLRQLEEGQRLSPEIRPATMAGGVQMPNLERALELLKAQDGAAVAA